MVSHLMLSSKKGLNNQEKLQSIKGVLKLEIILILAHRKTPVISMKAKSVIIVTN